MNLLLEHFRMDQNVKHFENRPEEKKNGSKHLVGQPKCEPIDWITCDRISYYRSTERGVG